MESSQRSTDPHERHNLLANPTWETAAVHEELRKALEEWAATARPLPTRFESSQRRETMERLRALGYLVPDAEEESGEEESTAEE